jgi:quercetin dioxygenase-like cupin family protein
VKLPVFVTLCASAWIAVAPLGAQTGAAVAIPSTAIPPDPKSIIAILPKDLKWKKESLGQLQAPLFGDPSKPGTYGVMIKWLPGTFSHPHSHSTDRWAYVVKGTWWVSTGTHRDIATTYPVKQGTFGIDFANQTHWDGAKDEEVILLVVGNGPVDTKLVPET